MRSPRCASSPDYGPPLRECSLPSSREQTLRAPRRVRVGSTVDETIVQTERTITPELDLHGLHAIAAPVWPARHFGERVFGGVFGDLLLEYPTAFHRARLRAGQCADI